MHSTLHTSVLPNQTLELLQPKPGGIYLDGTLGLGGHSELILEKLEGKGKLYGIEVDERNLHKAKERLHRFKNIEFIHDNFENLDSIAEAVLQKEGRIDGILFDLGLSSPHVDEAERGFSFQKEGPLDMRFDERIRHTAADLVNRSSLKHLLFIFQTYGEEPFARRIAIGIEKHRRQHPFKTTTELANFITTLVPKRFGRSKFHPATRVFQALRIATNREVEALQNGLYSAFQKISPGGRIIVISYHSLEDRLVKNFFRNEKRNETLNVLTKKPITPSEEEIISNPRSRSAKLRAAEKI